MILQITVTLDHHCKPFEKSFACVQEEEAVVYRMVFRVNLVKRKGGSPDAVRAGRKGLHASIQEKYQVTCVADHPYNTVGEVINQFKPV